MIYTRGIRRAAGRGEGRRLRPDVGGAVGAEKQRAVYVTPVAADRQAIVQILRATKKDLPGVLPAMPSSTEPCDARAAASCLALLRCRRSPSPCRRTETASAPPWVTQLRPDAERLLTAATADDFAWQRLAELTDTFGHRLSGSENLERAIAVGRRRR